MTRHVLSIVDIATVDQHLSKHTDLPTYSELSAALRRLAAHMSDWTESESLEDIGEWGGGRLRYTGNRQDKNDWVKAVALLNRIPKMKKEDVQ